MCLNNDVSSSIAVNKYLPTYQLYHLPQHTFTVSLHSSRNKKVLMSICVDKLMYRLVLSSNEKSKQNIYRLNNKQKQEKQKEKRDTS